MATFLEMQTRLLRAVNRPSSETETLADAKDAVNDVIVELQRDHAFNYTAHLATLSIPSGTFFVDLGVVCGGLLRDVISVEELPSGATDQGKPLKIYTYSELQALRGRLDRRTPPNECSLETFNIESHFAQDKVAFLLNNSLGLYPKPRAAVPLLVTFHIWLPELSVDADTNFFLVHARDLIFMKALKALKIMIKDTSDFQYSVEVIDKAIASLIAWDSQITSISRPI